MCAPVSARRLASVEFVNSPMTGSPFPLSSTGDVSGDGLYRVTVRSVDDAGNVEAGNTTMEWYVDTVPPVAAPELVQTPDKTVSARTALFLVRLVGDASPGQTAFVYTLDGGAPLQVPELPVPNTATVQLNLPESGQLNEGQHIVEVWAVDQAGNAGDSVIYDWFVTTAAPDLVVVATPADVSGDVSPGFQFTTVWPAGSARNGSEPDAAIQVDLGLGAGFETVCDDTVGSSGVCSWNASLAESGPGRYTLTARAVYGGATGDPSTFGWEYLLCSDGEYAVLGGDFGIECVGCPPGANCEGGLTAQSDLVAQPGFWAPEGANGLRFYECPIEEACMAGGSVMVGNTTIQVLAQCANGYTGTLCGVCADGFFEQFGRCAKCDTSAGLAWLVTFGVLIAVVALGVLFFKFRDLLPVDHLKVTLSMAQIIASANTAYAIPWPPLFADFLNTMRVFLIEAVSLTRASCAQPMTFYSSLAVTLVAFKVVLLIVVLGPVALHKWQQRGKPKLPTQSRSQPRSQPGQQTGNAAGGQRQRRRSSVMASIVNAAHAAQAIDWAKIFKITFLFLFVAYP
ncbi:MAG: hypothetical protein ACPG1A_13260, partial [Halioglobus sp.]